jgi:stress response protein YsnF
MNEHDNDVTVPVVAEELHADAIPVETGGVRVTKSVEGHQEILEQELRKSHVEIKRVKTERVVDGPQPVRRSGNTVVIPIVSEVLRVEKQWVVTEEIHITQTEQRETVQEKVQVNREVPRVERLDEKGEVVSTIDARAEREAERLAPPSLLQRADAAESASKKKVMSSSPGILRDRKASK